MLIKTITLDVSDNRITSPVNVQKLSVGDRIDIYLRSGGKRVNLSDTASIRLLAKKPDGTNLFNDCTHDSDKITYVITSQTISAPGVVECQLQITDKNNGEDLYLPVFSLNVSDNLKIGLESENESTAFSRYLAQMNDKESIYNKITRILSDSTDTQYPSAKAVYDAIKDVKDTVPTVSVTETTDGRQLTVTLDGESESYNISDGKTPVRGADYWTSADIAYIKSYVDDQILGGKW